MKPYFELILGPMFASKTTELIRKANRFSSIDLNVICINHVSNQRYHPQNISTHDKFILNDCLLLDKLVPLLENVDFKNADIIMIEELQFFEDCFDFIVEAMKMNKTVIAAALSGDYQRKPFENISKLIPHAEKITKLSALCKKCGDGTHADFTKRVVDNDQQILIGGSDSYEPVCRFHYDN